MVEGRSFQSSEAGDFVGDRRTIAALFEHRGGAGNRAPQNCGTHVGNPHNDAVHNSFCSSFDPLRNPFRMTAIYSLVAFRLVLAWYQIIIGREPLELHYLPQHVSRDGNPPSHRLGKKFSSSRLIMPMPPSLIQCAGGVSDFYVPQSEPRKKEVRHINRGIFLR